MLRHKLSLSIVVPALLLTGAGCGSGPRPEATVNVSSPTSATSTTGPVPVADDTAAVAALDGSAAFSIRDDQLVRIDPDTSEVTASWALPHGPTSINVVAPGGRWVALTDRQPGYDTRQPTASTELVVFDAEAGTEAHRLALTGDVQPEAFSVNGKRQPTASTELVVFDAEAGTEAHRLALTGDVQPEAFSVNGSLLFALDHRGDHYRVQTITLATGERVDTSDRDKSIEPEDMHGTTVRAVLNADHTLLSTLYRNPGDDDEPAFVHILDLAHGWAYCADLAAPFGTGPPGSDLIELTPAGTVVVTATQASRIAEIHIDEVRTPSTQPVTVEYRDATA